MPSVLTEVAVEHLARYAFSFSYIQNKKVLDLACGDGYGSFLLSQHANFVTAADVSESTIDHARTNYKANNLSFVKADATNLPFDNNSFDVVVSFETIEHVKDQVKVMEEIRRVCKQDALLIMSTPNKQTYSSKDNFTNPFHEKELTSEEFVTLLTGFFSNVLLLNQRSFHGSLIYADEIKINELSIANGDFNKIEVGKSFPDSDYLIALASNTEISKANPLFFSGQNIFEERFSVLKKTWTYKIGNTVVAPLRWLRQLVKR